MFGSYQTASADIPRAAPWGEAALLQSAGATGDRSQYPPGRRSRNLGADRAGPALHRQSDLLARIPPRQARSSTPTAESSACRKTRRWASRRPKARRRLSSAGERGCSKGFSEPGRSTPAAPLQGAAARRRASADRLRSGTGAAIWQIHRAVRGQQARRSASVSSLLASERRCHACRAPSQRFPSRLPSLDLSWPSPRRLWPAAAFALAILGMLAGNLAAAAAEVFNPKTLTLANGLQVVVVEKPPAPVVTHMVWYKVGRGGTSRRANPASRISSEHLMFKGTSNTAEGVFSRGGRPRRRQRENALPPRTTPPISRPCRWRTWSWSCGSRRVRMANLQLDDSKVLPGARRDPEASAPPGAHRQRSRLLLSEDVARRPVPQHPYRLPTLAGAHKIRGLGTEDAIDSIAAGMRPTTLCW